MSQQPQGVFDIEVWLDDSSLGGAYRVGALQRWSSRRGDTIDFAYSDEWLQPPKTVGRSFSLDPQLPLHRGQMFARAGADQLTGAFQDSSPDRWGKLLMDRREVVLARKEGRPVRNLRPWDYLLGVHDDSRMGALRLCESGGAYLDDSSLGAPPVTELRELEAIAIQIDKGVVQESAESDKWVKRLIVGGGSMGGARPKASVREASGELLMAKFPASDDRHDVGLWEFITYRLAIAAGINMPAANTKRFSDLGATFLVARFDRTPAGRRAYASAFTLMDVDDSESSSYLDLVEVIEHQVTPSSIGDDLRQLFRRVAFNVLIGNRDDHLRNHGFLRESGGWRLSPAFDVNPNPDKDAHVLAINENDPSPDTRLLLDTLDYYRLSKRDAAQMLEEVRTAVRGWVVEARKAGARSTEIAMMESVIDPER